MLVRQTMTRVLTLLIHTYTTPPLSTVQVGMCKLLSLPASAHCFEVDNLAADIEDRLIHLGNLHFQAKFT